MRRNSIENASSVRTLKPESNPGKLEAISGWEKRTRATEDRPPRTPPTSLNRRRVVAAAASPVPAGMLKTVFQF